MPTVELQFPVTGEEPMKVSLDRVPVPGEFFDFAEDHPNPVLQGESYEARSVIWAIGDFEVDGDCGRAIVVLRKP